MAEIQGSSATEQETYHPVFGYVHQLENDLGWTKELREDGILRIVNLFPPKDCRGDTDRHKNYCEEVKRQICQYIKERPAFVNEIVPCIRVILLDGSGEENCYVLQFTDFPDQPGNASGQAEQEG